MATETKKKSTKKTMNQSVGVSKQLDPNDYFAYIKSKKEVCTDEFLTKFYDTIVIQLKKAVSLEQNLMVRKLAFVLKTVEKERALFSHGVTTFVHREDIEQYIHDVEDKVVKIIDLEFYPRTIPDEIAAKVAVLKKDKIFDNYYIVFTDYTDEVGREVSHYKKRTDPIIFGVFEQKIDGIFTIHDRFYYIGDWEDEYCDLTLSKMVDAMSKKGKDITRTSLDLPDMETVTSYVNALEINDKDPSTMILRPQRKSLFKNIKTAAVNLFKKGK